MRNYVLHFMVLFSLMAFNSRTSAQTCTPSTPVCVAANGYAFQYFADTDYGLKFNTSTAEYQFTNAAGVGLFNIHANNGLVTVTEDLQVDGKVGIGSGNPMAVDFSVFNGVGHFGVPAGYAQFDQDGDLTFTGSADYLVGGDRYAFRYSAAPGYGLYFNATGARYEFRTNNATAVSHIDANTGDGYFKGNLKVGTNSANARVTAASTSKGFQANVTSGAGTNTTYGFFTATTGAGSSYGAYLDGSGSNPGPNYGAYTRGDNSDPSGAAYGTYAIVSGTSPLRAAIYGEDNGVGPGGYAGLFEGNFKVNGISDQRNVDPSETLPAMTLWNAAPTPSLLIDWAGDGAPGIPIPTGFDLVKYQYYGFDIGHIGTNGSAWFRENLGLGLGADSATKTLDVDGEARVRSLPVDNSLDNIVVADANGCLHTRQYSSLYDGDWTKDPFASNNYFNKFGRFEIGFDSAVSFGLNVHYNGASWIQGAIRGAAQFGPTIGYVGHQGQFDYQQDSSLSLSGQEIGILGRSTGTSIADNYGVLGHSNNWGGRFQYTNGTSVNNIVYLGGSNVEIAANDGTLNISGNTNVASNLTIGNIAVLDRLTSNGNIGIRRSTPNNTVIGQLNFSEPNFPNSWAGIRAWSEGGDDQVSLAFHTAYGTSNSALFIDQFGDIGFGGINASYQLQLSLDEGAKPSTSTWTIVSDERLKNINGTYDKGLDEILMLEPITYHYKNVGEVTFDENVLAKENIGFSAQEIQKVFPECVNTNENGYLDFNMHAILVAQVNAIKEQQAQIDELKTTQDKTEEIQELKAENADMKDRLTKVEQMLLQFDMSLDECCSNHQQQGNSVPAFNQPSLGQNVPNPFESSTIIPYYIPDNTESAYMIVNNIDGKELRNYPINQFGLGKVTFKTEDLSAGTYMYTLFVDGEIVDSKLMIVK